MKQTMIQRTRLSNYLQIGLLLTFLLPFFPEGCKSKQAEEVPMGKSTVVAVDTLSQDSSKLTKDDEKSDTLKMTTLGNTTQKTEATNEDPELSVKISKKSTILKMFLRPNNNYTGIATLIDCFSLLEFGYGLGIAFILWLIALVIKLKDFNNIFVLLNILGLIFLSVSHSTNLFNDKRLWGFWVCLYWGTAMIIYDYIILYKIRKNDKKPPLNC